jgi:hypothetical protein
MIVNASIFYATAREFFLRPEVIERRFVVQKCILSGGLPAGTFYDLRQSNTVGGYTATIGLTLFETSYCPMITRTPTRTISRSPTRTMSYVLRNGYKSTLNIWLPTSVVVTNSFFYAFTGNREGGAIYVENSLLDLSVNTTTFLTMLPMYAGAGVYAICRRLNISRSCFRDLVARQGVGLATGGWGGECSPIGDRHEFRALP